MNHHDVIVIGGGQAGLVIGYLLTKQGRDFTILEAGDGPAAAWRTRWDSLRLFTPVRHRQPARSGVPRRPRPLSRPATRSWPISTEVRRRFELPVEVPQRECARFSREPGRLRRRARRSQLPRGPGRRRHRPVPDAVRCRPSPKSAEPGRRSRCTAPTTARRTPFRPGPCSWSAAATRAFRSPQELKRLPRRPPPRSALVSFPAAPAVLGRDIFGLPGRDPPHGRTTRRVADRPPYARPRHPSSARAPVSAARRGLPPAWAHVRRRGVDRQLRGGHEPRGRHRHLGHRASGSTTPGSTRRCSTPTGAALPRARCHPLPRPVLPRAPVAAHPRLGAPGLGQGRRRAPRAADRRPRGRRRYGSRCRRFSITRRRPGR